jgi:hypothetical protein
MTELEKKIYERALEILPELEKTVKVVKTKARYISFPFFCDGVIDKIIYDTNESKFTKIEYTKGKGNGSTLGPSMNKFSSLFDEVETCSFYLPN